MLFVVIAYLWVSLYLYLILGGADFGVGILETFTSRKHSKHIQSTSYKSIGPIWEANHMWLIIAIVILFVGFPEIYSTLSIYLHLPLVLMLLGIIARGTAFAFRHYDAVQDRWQWLYTLIFRWSSLVTPFFLGLIAASTVSRHINPAATTFSQAYLWGWLNPFGISVGIFNVTISAYLASIYIIGETRDTTFRTYLISNAKRYFFLVLLAGLLVFSIAYLEKIPLLHWVFGGWIGQSAVLGATASIGVLFWAFKTKRAEWMRICVAFQVLMILIAATYQHFPELVLLHDGTALSLVQHNGGEKTLKALGWALVLGSIFILPFLGYLLFAFHQKKNSKDGE